MQVNLNKERRDPDLTKHWKGISNASRGDFLESKKTIPFLECRELVICFYLVIPERCEDEIHLYENAAKG